jgi:cobalt-zinc-cadmium efflux system protein
MHHHHHHHHPAHPHPRPHRILILAIAIIVLFAIIEALGGWWAGSLTLLSDAGHMVSDAAALGIAALGGWLALQPPSHKHSYGLGRAEIVAAWISSLLMLFISLFVIVEAIRRIHNPHPVHGSAVMAIALLGIAVNFFVAWLLARGERTLNIRAALLHIMSDILGSIAALIAGAVIYLTNWVLIDPILSIGVGVLILISSIFLMRESLFILMEAVPGHIDLKEVAETMTQIKGVKTIHDLHIWTLSSGMVALSAHVFIVELSSWQHILNQLREALKSAYDIQHVTLQPEPEIIDCQPCLEPDIWNNKELL